MTEHVFDVLLRRASTMDSRRGIVATLASLTLGGIGSALFGTIDAEANNNHKKRKRRRKKRKKNNVATSPPPPPLPCILSCAGKVCGDDGCGGSCGTCGTGECCVGGSCLCASGFKLCQEACIPVTNCCTSAECGAVSCSNGTCDCSGQPDGTDCGNGGQCVTGVCTPPPNCAGLLGTCIENGDCCSDGCQSNGTCACSQAGEACHISADCCAFPAEQDCVNFVCVAS
jgi:hypothetical protein